jgi:glycogen debranching enzyme
VPQAWAAGSAFMLTQAMLRFMPDAPHNKLYVDPWLSEWLPDLTIQDIRVGHHKLTIRFWLSAGETHFEVIKGDRNIIERREFQSSFAPSIELAKRVEQSQV